MSRDSHPADQFKAFAALVADYCSEAVTLKQLMALSITDDHAAQETVF